MKIRRNPDIVAGRINAAGAVLVGRGFTVLKDAGAGRYTIFFDGGWLPIAMTVTAMAGFGGSAMTATQAIGGGMQVQLTNGSNVGQNIDFHFVAVGG